MSEQGPLRVGIFSFGAAGETGTITLVESAFTPTDTPFTPTDSPFTPTDSPFTPTEVPTATMEPTPPPLCPGTGEAGEAFPLSVALTTVASGDAAHTIVGPIPLASVVVDIPADGYYILEMCDGTGSVQAFTVEGCDDTNSPVPYVDDGCANSEAGGGGLSTTLTSGTHAFSAVSPPLHAFVALEW